MLGCPAHLTWNPEKRNEFVMVGQKAVWFWTFENGRLWKTRGKLGRGKRTNYFCAVYTDNGDVLCGGQDGSIHTFKNGQCKKSTSTHKGGIFALYNYGGCILSGGKDGRVVVMDQRLAKMTEVKLPGRLCKVRSLAVKDDQLYVGTSRNEVYCVGNFQRPKVGQALVTGHFDGEVWAVAPHPTRKGLFASVGEDNLVCLWNSEDHSCMKQAPLSMKKGARNKKRRRTGTMSRHPTNKCARGIAFSPDGDHIAIGTNQGHLRVFDASLKEVCSHNLNKHGKRKVKNQDDNWIQELKYSPDGKMLAVGTHGMVIVLCDVQNGYRPARRQCKAHNAAVVHLDWSADSAAIRSTCIAYELLFHSVDGSQITRASTLKDEKWATETLPFGWGVQGVFSGDQDGTDVNCVDRCGDVLATGDDYGNVNLYRYPCMKSAQKRAFCGHSSHVANCRFTADGQFLITAGGNDKSIMQWRVSNNIQ